MNRTDALIWERIVLAADTQRAELPPCLSPARCWTGLMILMLLSIFAYLDRGILALLVEPMKADLHLSDVQLGLLQGIAFALFYVFCGLPMGWLADRYSRRGIIGISVGIWSLAATGCGLARNFSEMLIGRFAVGAGEAGLAPSAYSLISDLFPRKRLTMAMTVYAFGAAIGPVAALLCGGVLLHSAEGGKMTLFLLGEMPAWRAVLILTGAPGLVLAPLVFLVPERRMRRPSTPSRSQEGVLAFLAQRKAFFACHFIGYGSVALIAYAIGAWTPAYLMRVHGWNPAQAGSAMALVHGLPAIAASFVGALIVDRMFAVGRSAAHFEYYVVGAAIVSLAGGFAYLTTNVHLGLVLIGITYIFLPVAGFASAAVQLVTPPQFRGQVSALYIVFIGLMGAGLGPLSVGLFTEYVFQDEQKLGLGIAATIAVFGPIALLCFLLGIRHMRVAIAACPEDSPQEQEGTAERTAFTMPGAPVPAGGQ